MNFTEIPSGNLVPMFMTEFDGSAAAKGGAMPWKNLLIGQPLKGSAGEGGGLKQITSDAQAASLFGAGSQLALMIQAFRKNSTTSELWALPVSDKGDAKASGKVTVSFGEDDEGEDVTAAPYGGTIRLMVAGVKCNVAVKAGDTLAEVAANIVAAVKDIESMPVDATAEDGVVTLTAKNAGEFGNGIDIRYNHSQGEELPVGVEVAVTPMAGGAADPNYANDKVFEGKTIEQVIRGTWYNAIVIGSSTEDNITTIKEILDVRWTATVQQTGVLFVSKNGKTELDELTAFGKKLNSQVIAVPSIPQSPTPGFVVAAATLGCVAPKSLNDPALPLSNWPVRGIVAPKESDREGYEGNNAILGAGLALLVAQDDGSVLLKRTVTTYKTNAAGAKDTAYQQLERVFTLSFLRWDWNNYLAGKYPHSKLADDGTDFGPGQVIMTPNLGKGELLGRYEYWISKGLVQNYESFKENLVVMRDPDDDTALQFLIPAELVSQFFIGKSKIQFK